MFKVDQNANINGTHLQGYILSSYRVLSNNFGEPDSDDEYKISGSWAFKDAKGNVCTIYDWKATKLYDRSLPTVAQFRKLPMFQFNVGGHDSKAVKAFIEQLKNQDIIAEGELC